MGAGSVLMSGVLSLEYGFCNQSKTILIRWNESPVRPLLIVPGLFGTEILDETVGSIWGPFSCLYRGPPVGELPAMRGRPGRVMSGIRIGPAVVYDIIGALQKALGRAGYQLGGNMFLFAYDWRARVIETGPPLATEIR